jgi:DNA polymerase III delta prime subunit
MEKIVGAKNISDIVGYNDNIKTLRNWIENVIKNPKTERRVCFLTGAIGCGKSRIARLLLKDYNFTLREFDSNDLRQKQSREFLLQTLRFKDVIALMNKSFKTKPFRKAVVVDDIENIGLGTQELYRNIRELFKKNRTIGVPIIFTSNRIFKGKRPLSAHSIYVHLKKRTKQEILLILNNFINKLNFNNLKNNLEEKKLIVQNSAGDIRNIIKHLQSFEKNNNVVMEKKEEKGPLYSLSRIINIDNNRTLTNIYSDLTNEGSTIAFGLHASYINYIPWKISNDINIYTHSQCSYLYKEISEIFADYGMFLDKERLTNVWSIRDIAVLYLGQGFRSKIKEKLKDKKRNKKIKFKGKDFWWKNLGKFNGRQGDETVDTPCMNKTLRSSLISYQLQNMSFKMIQDGVGNPHSWKPGTNRRTIELLRLSNIKCRNRDRITKLIEID